MVTVCLRTFNELCDTADDELLSKTVRLSHHVLHTTTTTIHRITEL